VIEFHVPAGPGDRSIGVAVLAARALDTTHEACQSPMVSTRILNRRLRHTLCGPTRRGYDAKGQSIERCDARRQFV